MMILLKTICFALSYLHLTTIIFTSSTMLTTQNLHTLNSLAFLITCAYIAFNYNNGCFLSKIEKSGHKRNVIDVFGILLIPHYNKIMRRQVGLICYRMALFLIYQKIIWIYFQN